MRTLYNGAAEALFAFTAAGDADFIIFYLMMFIHQKICICHGDAIQIFGQIHLFVHSGAFLLKIINNRIRYADVADACCKTVLRGAVSHPVIANSES
mgnify:CR=1 FL=1